ncbi:MAG: phosphatidate cytidylyltransferase [Firmicutes bacterium]|nr:phosphatidate cytidylyltransferase [Bacillota bacterium]
MGQELVRGLGMIILYYLVLAGLAITIKQFVKIPKEVFRKTLHLILLGSLFGWIYAFETWFIAFGAVLGFLIVVYPILHLAERFRGYSELLVERNRGEIKRSLVAVCLMLAILIAVCWGLFGQKYLVIAAVSAWGLGDAAAALVGKRFGKRHIEGRYVEGKKSLEGTLAMFVVSFLSVLAVLVAYRALKWHGYVPVSLITATVSSTVELYTKGGMDTLTCPLAAASVLIPLVYLWGA